MYKVLVPFGINCNQFQILLYSETWTMELYVVVSVFWKLSPKPQLL